MVSVLHIINGLGVGGAEMMLLKLLKNMDSTRFSSTVVALTANRALEPEYRDTGAKFHCLEMSRGAISLRALADLFDLYQQAEPDVIQSWMVHSDIMATLVSRFGSHVPTIWGIRNSLLDASQAKLMTRLCVRSCAFLSRFVPSRIVCNSQRAVRQYISIGYSPSRIVYIPNGFDIQCFKPDPQARLDLRQEWNVAEDDVLIGLVGRYHPLKGHFDFFRACAPVLTKFPKVRVIMCGLDVSCQNSELMGIIRSMGMNPDRFRLLGMRADIPRIMAALDLLVNSSISEGFPNVLGEAMACEVPCIATDVGDAGVLVSGTGWLVPPERPTDLSDAIRKGIQAGAEGRAQKGKLSRERICRDYSIEAIAGRYSSMYEELSTPARA